MALSIDPPDNTTETQKKKPIAKPFNVEIIRASTPLFIALIGGIIGIIAVVLNVSAEDQDNTAFGLASTAIAGAAGLAQSHREKDE